MADVTAILQAASAGDPRAAEQLLPLVYEELRKLAALRLAQEKPGQTLQATALVHEAYLRLVGEGVGNALGGVPPVKAQEPGVGIPGSEDNSTPDTRSPTSDFRSPTSGSPTFDSRGHFFAAAAEAMRRILVDAARAKGSLKRGGDRERIDLPQIAQPEGEEPLDLLALDEALQLLEQQHPEKAQLVKLKFFAGLTLDKAAAAAGISRATAERRWAFARAWLYGKLRESR